MCFSVWIIYLTVLVLKTFWTMISLEAAAHREELSQTITVWIEEIAGYMHAVGKMVLFKCFFTALFCDRNS